MAELTRRTFTRLVALGVAGAAVAPRALAVLPLTAIFAVRTDAAGVFVTMTVTNTGPTTIELQEEWDPSGTLTAGEAQPVALTFRRVKPIVYARRMGVEYVAVAAGKSRTDFEYVAAWPTGVAPGTKAALALAWTGWTATEKVLLTQGPISVVIGEVKAGV